MKIKHILAREILDSRGTPTIEVDLFLENGSFGRAQVPGGTSSGSHEAVELRDGGDRYGGKGVQKAVAIVNNELKNALLGKDFDQALLDRTMIALDGTENKSRLGGNSLLGVSIAFAKACAFTENKSIYEHIQNISQTPRLTLPTPMILVLEGGKHADQSSDFQEFMIVPRKMDNFKDTLEAGVKIYQTISDNLKKDGFNTNVGFEGAFGPNLKSNAKVLEVINRAITESGYTGSEISIAIDVAANEIYNKETRSYDLKSEGKSLKSDELIKYYEQLITSFPIASIEDPLAEDDWEGYQQLTTQLGEKLQIVGDDLFVTNPTRVKRGIELRAGNAVLIKPNQIGTLTETLDAIKLAKENNYKTIISHRSGDTEDAFIADLAVGIDAGQIKTGAPSRSERLAKYNQLLRIEEELQKTA